MFGIRKNVTLSNLSKNNSNQVSKTVPPQIFKLSGNPNNVRKIRRLDTKIPSNTQTLLFKNVELGREFLDVVSVCKNLEVITLENVGLFQTFHRRVVLPKLRKFSLEITNPAINDGDTWNQYVNKSTFDMKSLLFFDRKPEDSWKLDDLYSMDIDIDLTVNGVTLIKVNHEDDELALNKGKHIQFQPSHYAICQLSLAHCSINGDLPFEYVTRLVLFNVSFSKNNLQTYVTKCKRLTDLSIWNPEAGTLDFAKLGQNLKRISLYNFQLTCSPPAINKQITQLTNVTEVALYSCSWDDLFLIQLPVVFPELSKLTLNSCVTSVATLLLKIISNVNQLPLTWIYLRNFDWSVLEKPDIKKIIECFQISAEDFMSNEPVIMESKSEKSLRWSASLVGENSEQRHELLYSQFQFCKFWKDFATYRKY